MIKIISIKASNNSAKLRNEMPINSPSKPPIFEIKSNEVVFTD